MNILKKLNTRFKFNLNYKSAYIISLLMIIFFFLLLFFMIFDRFKPKEIIYEFDTYKLKKTATINKVIKTKNGIRLSFDGKNSPLDLSYNYNGLRKNKKLVIEIGDRKNFACLSVNTGNTKPKKPERTRSNFYFEIKKQKYVFGLSKYPKKEGVNFKIFIGLGKPGYIDINRIYIENNSFIDSKFFFYLYSA